MYWRDWSSDVSSSDLPLLFGVWALLMAHTTAARLRYVWFTAAVEGLALSWRHAAYAPVSVLVDATAWVRSALDMVVAGRSEERRVGRECRPPGAPEQD